MRTVVVAVLGGLLTLAGIGLLVLPGPGFVLVAAGLAVLSTQFAWARKPLDYAKEKAQEGIDEVGRSWFRAGLAIAAGLVLVVAGVLPFLGIDLPFVTTVSAVLLIVSGLFLLGTVVYARRETAHSHP